jgi:hypothetical protein
LCIDHQFVQQFLQQFVLFTTAAVCSRRRLVVFVCLIVTVKVLLSWMFGFLKFGSVDLELRWWLWWVLWWFAGLSVEAFSPTMTFMLEVLS